MGKQQSRLPGLLIGLCLAIGIDAYAQEPASEPAESSAVDSAAEQPVEPTDALAASETEAPPAEAGSDVSVIEVAPMRDAPAEPGPTEKAAVLDTIEVTGSRIRRSDYETAQPVTVVTREDIARTGLSNVGDLLQELPSAGSALNRGFNNGGAGTAEVDLRNLGSQRVLILLDGRRWIPGVGNYPAVDLNTVPVSIIERIEVLKDGASAIYGSDAVAGVINIITRKDYSGASFQAQANVFDAGDGLQQQYSANWGISDERTSLFLDLNFVRQAEVMAGDREISSVPLHGTGLTRGSPFTPEGTLIFIPTPSNGSILGTELCPDLAPGVANSILAGRGIDSPFPDDSGLPVGGLQLCDMLLKPGETITGGPGENTATVAGRYRPRNPTSLGADNGNYNFAPINYLLTPFDQASVFAQIHHQLLDNVDFNGRVLYNRHKTERHLAETPLLFGDLFFPPYNRIYVAADQIYNPFDQDIGRHPGQGTPPDSALGVGPGTGTITRRFVEAGPRFLARTTDTLFLTGTLQGDFNTFERLFSWDVGYANGRISNTNQHRGDLILDKVERALGPAAGCAAPCVPLNLFGGPGTITQDQLDYVLYEATSSSGGALQYVWAGIGGETSDLGFLAAPLGVAVGAEYRTDDFENNPDPYVAAGNSSTNIQRPTQGSTRVKEAFIEIDVPLLADLPLIQELGLELAGRYSDYGRFDPATTGKVGLRWKPADELLVRSTWSQAFRAPSVVDLYQGDSDGYPQLDDPCVEPEAGSVEERNCQADGVNTATVQQSSAQILTRFGGNPDLEPETATSITGGLVYSPQFVENLNFTLDYYQIEAEDFISNIGPDFILHSCYRTERTDGARPVTCDFVVRGQSGSIQYIKSPTFNFSKVKTSGIEFAFDYSVSSDNYGLFKILFDSSYLLAYDQFTPNADGSSTEENYAGVNAGNTPFPRLKFNTTLSWAQGPWSASWTTRFIYHTFEHCDDGRAPSLREIGLCSMPDDDLSDASDDSRNELETTIYHNVQLGFAIQEWQTELTLGVINVLDTDPPISYTAFANSFPATLYEPPGMQPYVRLLQRF